MRIGIIGAMDVEIAVLRSAIQNVQVSKAAGMEFLSGRIANQDVVVVKSGIGKVNAAVCAQILIDRFEVKTVINTGVAGSLNNDLNIEDFLLSEDVVHHDVDATIFGYSFGEVPQLGTKSFSADRGLMEKAQNALKEAGIETGVHIGRVASGDQFICSADKKKWIRDTFKADCCEMEGAAIAQTCYINNVPFLIIRAISDKADESVAVSYDEFEKKAAEDCAKLLLTMLSRF